MDGDTEGYEAMELAPYNPSFLDMRDAILVADNAVYGGRDLTAVWQVYPLQVLNAAAHAVTASVAIPFFQDLSPAQPGAATTLYSNALKAGSVLGLAAFGLLASYLGNTRLFWVCAGFALVTLGVVSFARHRHDRD